MRTLTERLAGTGGPRRRIAAVVGAIVLVATAIAVVASAGAPATSKGQGSGGNASGSTTVQRRDLVQTDTESGTLGYANQQTVFNRLSGTITYLPRVGALIKPGGTLYEVSRYPVKLFTGSYPAFRDLTSGDTNGPDIAELNADLKAMGFDPGGAITVNQTWQTATTDAVVRWQASIGQSQTGTISLGQIVFLPGPQLINTVDTTLGSTGAAAGAGSGSSGSAATGASYKPNPTPRPTRVSYPVAGQPHAQFVDLTTSSAPSATTSPTTPTTPATTTTPTTTTTPAGPTGPAGPTVSQGSLEAIVKLLETQNRLLQAELLAAKKSAAGAKGSTGSTSGSVGGGARSTGNSGAGGGGSAASSGGSASAAGGGSSGAAASSSGGGSASAGATAILVTSSSQLVVTVNLDATKQSEAKLNAPVTVQLPDGTTVNGKITAVSPVAQSSSSSSSSSGSAGAGGGSSTPSATIPVTISLAKQTDSSALDQAAVSVNFQQQVAKHVLSVPVTALLATQGGGYAIQEANPPHKLIPVTPGLFAAGYVQISGPQVQDGMLVTDSQG